MLDQRVVQIARAVKEVGGRALIVGGYVRDRLLGRESKDVDVEVYDLDLEALEGVLAAFGPVTTIGRAFGVLRVKGLDVDFSLPRRDSKIGAGHKGFEVTADPGLDFSEASRRRDLTINAIGLDPLTEEILDPLGGREDLQAGVLRAADAAHFAEDPLRAVRVAQFAARFSMQPDAELEALCAELDLSELSAERVYDELRKLLLKGERPSLGFEFLRRTGLLRFFPELQALVDVPQDAEWHPEGDVWIHSMMVIDEAAQQRDDAGEDALAFMLGALCHDLGKPETTVHVDGRVRSPGHDKRGIPHTEKFLGRFKTPNELVTRVCALVEHHLAPAHFVKHGATAKGYRRLARKLQAAGVTMELLWRVARADHFGRTTPEAVARKFPSGDIFLEKAAELLVDQRGPDAFVARVPVLDHCAAHGDTADEAVREVVDAAEAVLDVMREDGQKLPAPDAVDIAAAAS